MSTANPVYIIGAGPGDPELLTFKAHRLLGEADVIVHDRLVSDKIMDIAPPTTERIFAGKAARHHFMAQDKINELLVELHGQGKKIVRLKGGDPFIFGRGSEEAAFLAQHDIQFEIIPGITAAGGASSYAGIPLTHRGISRSVHFVTGHSQDGRHIEQDLNWDKIADPDATLVLYMGLTNIALITKRLMEAGLSGDTPAAAIYKATMPDQRMSKTTLAELPAIIEKGKYIAPTLLIIGHVVSLSDDLNWAMPVDI